MINVFQPSLSAAELAAVARVFHSNWLGKGQKVDEFEAAWAKHIGVDSANVVSVNSCTEGLFQAVQLLGIGPGDEVIIPTIHFIGAAQAVLSVGARPVFCDVDSRTLNTTAGFIEAKITGRTRGVILNHYGGVPCQMDEIIHLLKYHFQIMRIEDAACAPASTFSGQAAGTFGDIGIWSFDSMKVISTGDGGMLYIRDNELADRARKQLYLGIDSQSGLSSDAKRWWEFEVEIEGARRSVMNDIAAGIGLEQLKKLAGFVERRRDINNLYLKNLAGLYLNKSLEYSGRLTIKGEHSFYFHWIQTPRRDELAAYLKANDIYCTFRYWPLHLAYHTGDSLPNAEWAAQNTLLLPLHQSLTDEQVEFISNTVIEFYRK